jgi:hypothetical protein
VRLQAHDARRKPGAEESAGKNIAESAARTWGSFALLSEQSCRIYIAGIVRAWKLPNAPAVRLLSSRPMHQCGYTFDGISSGRHVRKMLAELN